MKIKEFMDKLTNNSDASYTITLSLDTDFGTWELELDDCYFNEFIDHEFDYYNVNDKTFYIKEKLDIRTIKDALRLKKKYHLIINIKFDTTEIVTNKKLEDYKITTISTFFNELTLYFDGR